MATAPTINRSRNIKLPAAPAVYDVQDQNALRGIIERHYHPGDSNTLSRPFIYADDPKYGIVGDDVVDDTAGFQGALDDATLLNKILYCGSLTIRISGPCVGGGPGLLFDRVSHGSTGGPGVHVTGTAYKGTQYTDLSAGGAGSTLTSAAHPFDSTYVEKYMYLTSGTNGVVDRFQITAVAGVVATLDHPVTTGAMSNGVGYIDSPALTMGGIISMWKACIYGDGVQANLLYLRNPLLSHFEDIRCFNTSGYGFFTDNCWDNVFNTVSVEQCGNALNYAFVVADGRLAGSPSTSNQSHFKRIQVEKSLTKAIHISGSTLSCNFDNIHSEQDTPTPGVDTWYLGGGRCAYRAITLASLVPANATCQLALSNSTLDTMLVVGPTTVNVNANDTVTLIDLEVQGTLQPFTNQSGIIHLVSGRIQTLNADPTAFWRIFGSHISLLNVGFSNNPVDPTWLRCHNSQIDEMKSTSTLSSGTFVDCTISEGHDLLQGQFIMHGGVVTCTGTGTTTGGGTLHGIVHNSGYIECRGGRINGSINFSNHATIRGYGMILNGNIACVDAGTSDVVMDHGSIITGTRSGIGIPTAGAHFQGEHHKNMTPATGNDLGWICTAAGTPGTWAVEATGGASPGTLTIGTHLTGGSFNGSVNVTIATDATAANVASTIMARDGSGNFNAQIAALVGLTSTSCTITTINGTTFNVSSTINVPILLVSNKIQMGSGNDIFLGNSFAAGAPAATGTLTVKDLGGTPYRLLCAP